MLDKEITEYSYSVIDIETTGLSPHNGCKIVEIAAVKIEPSLKLNLKNYFNELINPEMKIPYNAYKVHKINNEMVADASTIGQVLPKLSNFTKDTIIVAHNAKFDMKFIDFYCKEYNIELAHLITIDTLKLSRKIFPDFRNHKLDTLIRELNIELSFEQSWRHRALFDAAHTAILLQKLFERAQRIHHKLTLNEFLNLYHQ
jgi:DNA polymerase-3 subunit epsilon